VNSVYNIYIYIYIYSYIYICIFCAWLRIRFWFIYVISKCNDPCIWFMCLFYTILTCDLIFMCPMWSNIWFRFWNYYLCTNLKLILINRASLVTRYLINSFETWQVIHILDLIFNLIHASTRELEFIIWASDRNNVWEIFK
jgi:hypothetical protein